MIDAYTHCGISKFKPVEDVLDTMHAASVDRAVLVQHLGEYDNGYLERVVATSPGRFAGVALVDATWSDWDDRVMDVAGSDSFQGLRMTTAMLLANSDLAVVAARAGLVPVLFTPDGVALAKDSIRQLASEVPHGKLVITHLGCPVVQDDELSQGWDLLDLADVPNVTVTLSGLAMFCEYPHRPLHGFIRNVVEAFTPERIMWGSNFPVGGGTVEYVRDLDLVLSGEWDLTEDEVVQITEETAARLFFGDAHN